MSKNFFYLIMWFIVSHVYLGASQGFDSTSEGNDLARAIQLSLDEEEMQRSLDEDEKLIESIQQQPLRDTNDATRHFNNYASPSLDIPYIHVTPFSAEGLRKQKEKREKEEAQRHKAVDATLLKNVESKMPNADDQKKIQQAKFEVKPQKNFVAEMPLTANELQKYKEAEERAINKIRQDIIAQEKRAQEAHEKWLIEEADALGVSLAELQEEFNPKYVDPALIKSRNKAIVEKWETEYKEMARTKLPAAACPKDLQANDLQASPLFCVMCVGAILLQLNVLIYLMMICIVRKNYRKYTAGMLPKIGIA